MPPRRGGHPGDAAGPDARRRLGRAPPAGALPLLRRRRGRRAGRRGPHDPVRHPRPAHGLFATVLALAAEELDRADARRDRPMIRVGGVCGRTSQAVAEAEVLREHGYHAGLLSLAALADADDRARMDHCRAVAGVLPIVGFYLQRAVGGPSLSYRFWRAFAEIEGVGRDQDRAVRSLPDPRRRPRRRRVGPRRHRVVHGQRRQHRARSDHAVPGPDRPPAGRAADRRRPARPLGGLDPPGGRAARRLPGRRGGSGAAAGRVAPAGGPRHRLPTRRSSTPPTASPAASPASTRSSAARACSRGSGASTRTRASAPASSRRSTGSTGAIPS